MEFLHDVGEGEEEEEEEEAASVGRDQRIQPRTAMSRGTWGSVSQNGPQLIVRR